MKEKLYPRVGDNERTGNSVVHKREERGLDTGGAIRAVANLSHHQKVGTEKVKDDTHACHLPTV